MMSEWINEPAHAPTIRLISNGPDGCGSRLDGPLENGVRMIYDHNHSDGTATKRLGTEIEMFRRLIREPKAGPAYGQLGYYRSGFAVQTKQHLSSKGCFVEFDRAHSVANRQHRFNRDRLFILRWRRVHNNYFSVSMYWQVP
jgi:hypothetical protein